VRVAHLTATFPPYLGGAGTTCLQLARGMAARGHEVEVFTAPAPGPPADPDGVRVHRLPPIYAIGNAPLIPALAGMRGFDVVHLHHPFIFGTELALIARVRERLRSALVVSYHNQLIGEGRRRTLFAAWEATVGRTLVASADAVCVLSEAHAATVPTLRRIDPARVAVLPNGVDTERFGPGPDEAGWRSRLGVPEHAVVAAFVGTLDRAHYPKRLDLALEAVAHAGDERLHVVVAGGGEWLERYRAQAARLGLEGRVHFAGPVDHDRLPELLRAADLLLLSSDLESFGIVLLEAMASGLPTVSTDPPGVLAVVRAGETGVLAPRGNAAALGAALGRLARAEPAERRRMGAAGRLMCERHYAWGRLMEPLEATYAAAVERRRRLGRRD